MSKIKDFILQEIERSDLQGTFDEPWPGRIEAEIEEELLPWCWQHSSGNYVESISNEF